MELQEELAPVSPARPPAVKKHPDFFIIGAPKCGTTAMSEYLSHHRDIYMARKEMLYFGRDLQFGPQMYRRNREDYLKEFDGWRGQSRAGEASVWYLFSQQAAAEIKAFNPEARIIIMIREPVEMLYSLYHQYRLDGNEHLPTFQAALAAQDDRRAGRKLTRRTYFRQGLIYHETARYAEQISRYFKAFGRDQVEVVLYDDFAAKTPEVYTRVLEFLGVDATPKTGHFRVINGSQAVKRPWLRNLMSDPLVRGTAVAAHAWLPRPVFSLLREIESRLQQSNIRLAKRPPMDPDLRRHLQREFAPEVERLSELLGRDLTAWSRSEPARAKPDGLPDVAVGDRSGPKAHAKAGQAARSSNQPTGLALNSNS